MESQRCKKIIIRADASAHIGSGHMMRMLAFGQLLFDEGYEVHFATIFYEGFHWDLLKQQGFVIHLLAQQKQWEELYDFTQFVKLSASLNPEWVVLDGYQFTSFYEQALKQSGFQLLRIDDVPQGHYYADVILNQNFGAENLVYDKEPATLIFSGLQHVLLRREFRYFTPFNRPVKKNGPWRLMVSLGGSLQKTGMAYSIINQALADLPELIVNVVSGQKNIAQEIFDADFAIVSAGSTMWELVYMRVPFLAVALNNKQRDYLQMLAKEGLCVDLGLSEELICETVRQTVLDFVRAQDVWERMKNQFEHLMDRKTVGQVILKRMAARVLTT